MEVTHGKVRCLRLATLMINIILRKNGESQPVIGFSNHWFILCWFILQLCYLTPALCACYHGGASKLSCHRVRCNKNCQIAVLDTKLFHNLIS